MRTFVRLLVLGSIATLCALPAWSGSIFLTGHDPDFHATAGNVIGARDINQRAIAFITDPAFNPYASPLHKFLFVEDQTIGVPLQHLDGVPGIVASGYILGTDFDVAGSAATLNTLLNGGALGTTYDAIVIGSDFGGLLTQAELDVLNAHSSTIINFINNGGGLYAMAECGNPAVAPCLTSSGDYGYLPFLITGSPVQEAENGNLLTPFGLSLGLSNSDINGNFSHTVFLNTGGMNVVDHDAGGEILSLATRSRITTHGVPEPASSSLLAAGLACLLARRRRTSA